MNSRSDARLSLLARMALVAAVVGAALSASATERLTVGLLFWGAVSWSFVPVLQLATGGLLIRGAAGDRIGLLDRYFATGWPWSLWILGVHAAFVAVPPLRDYAFSLLLTAGIAVVSTVRLLTRFCQDELGLDAAGSRRRVALHQAATFAILLGYVSFAIALWPRVLGSLE